MPRTRKPYLLRLISRQRHCRRGKDVLYVHANGTDLTTDRAKARRVTEFPLDQLSRARFRVNRGVELVRA